MTYELTNIVFPTIPHTKEIDPIWQEESIVAKENGYNVLVYSIEDGKVYQDSNAPIVSNLRSLYRGTILTDVQYLKMASSLIMISTLDEYLLLHECFGWVDKIHRYTFPTQYQQVPFTLPFDNKQEYYIKSTTTSYGEKSHVKSQSDIEELIHDNNISEGDVLCIRDYVQLSDTPKQRFFCVEEDAYGYNGAKLPEEIRGAVKALNKRYFYTLDVAYRLDGSPIIVKVGDAQVADLREWDLQQFYKTVIENLTTRTKQDYMTEVFGV